MQLDKNLIVAFAVLLAACSASTAGKAPSIEQEAPTIPDAATPTALDQESSPSTGSVFRASYHDCVSANDASTWDVQDCIETEFVYQDARLNSTYNALLSSLPDEGREKLKAEEKAWIIDKEANCKWNAETEGQAQRIEANVCSLEKTAARAKHLELRLQESMSK